MYATKLARSDKEKTVNELRVLGFTEHEAWVYLSLLQRNPATGYEVSKDTGLPRANVYSTVDGLVNKGMLQPVGGRPRRYIAVPLREVVQRIKSDTARRCDRVLETVSLMDWTTEVDYVWHIRGLDQIRSKCKELIEGAKKHIGLRALDANISVHEKELRDASHRGVDVVMVVFGNEGYDFGTCYLHEATGMIPIGNVERTVIVTVDFEEALIASLFGDPAGAVTRDAAVVSIAETVVRHDVYLSEIFRKFGPALDRTFGPALLELRRRHRPDGEVADLERKLRDAGRLSKEFE
jgi:sugar-specific transcriptional regulator TrmB